MKTLLISTALILLTLISFSIEKNKEGNKKNLVVPEIVLKAFADQQVGARKVEWEEEKSGEYEAEFVLNRHEVSVIYDSKGILLKTEMEIKKSELPQSVKDALTKDFTDYKIEELEKIDVKGVITFEIEAEKGNDEVELVFDNNGKLLEKKEINDEDEDGENEK